VSDEDASTRTGFLLGTFAYLWWGLVPLYFSALKAEHVGAGEILAHRVVWSLPVIGLLTLASVGWRPVVAVLRSRKLLALMVLSSALLAVNWLLYIYATILGRVAEGSLGYFMLPIVNAFLGTVFLGEKLRPAHYPALAIIAAGLCIPLAAAGSFPWLAFTLPITFGLYGFVRKAMPVDSLTGLTVESLVMLLPAAGFLVFLSTSGVAHFGPSWGLNGLLMFSGIVTVAPLLTYIMSLKRLPLVAVSFLQFISPTTQMLIAIILLGETPTREEWAAYVCVWVAVAIFLADAGIQFRRSRRKAEPQRSPEPVAIAPVLVSAKL
jgi:chloramphenicol-sensitive protein RarD